MYKILRGFAIFFGLTTISLKANLVSNVPEAASLFHVIPQDLDYSYFAGFTPASLSLVSSDPQLKITDPETHSPLPETGSKPPAALGNQSGGFYPSAADYVNGTHSLVPMITFLLTTAGPSGGNASETATPQYSSALPFSDPSNILVVPLTSANYIAPQSVADGNYYQFQSDNNYSDVDSAGGQASTTGSFQTIAPLVAGVSSADPTAAIALDIPDPTPASVPEAATLTLLGIGLAGLLIASKRAVQARG